jgi:hypothetical protein
MATDKEKLELLKGKVVYRCKSRTCSNGGGVCVLLLPEIDFRPPMACVNPECFYEEQTDCEWEMI